MKTLKNIFLFVILIGFSSCVGEDIIEDEIDASLRINGSLVSLAVGDTYQYQATYLNNVGKEEEVDLQWSSSNPDIVTINPSTGVATAIKIGEAIISVSTPDDPGVSQNVSLQITLDETVIDNQTSKSGTLDNIKSDGGDSGYKVVGNVVLEEIEGENIFRLSITNFDLDTSLPDGAIYLSNNITTTSNALLIIGPVTEFSGDQTFDISKDKLKNNHKNNEIKIFNFCTVAMLGYICYKRTMGKRKK